MRRGLRVLLLMVASLPCAARGGTVIVIRTRMLNGYPVIDCYGHTSADSGYWSTWVYDGQRYVGVSSAYVEEISQTKSFGAIRDVPSVVGAKRPQGDR